MLVNYGVSAGEQATNDVGDFFRIGGFRYYGRYLFTEFGGRSARDDFGVLAELGHLAERLTPVKSPARGSSASIERGPDHSTL